MPQIFLQYGFILDMEQSYEDINGFIQVEKRKRVRAKNEAPRTLRDKIKTINLDHQGSTLPVKRIESNGADSPIREKIG